jgi:hypothetical protein
MDKKYDLKDSSIEDQKAFKQGLEELLTKLSLNLSVNIIKVPISIKLEDGTIKNVFADEPTILLQKKVEIAEPEAPKITDVEATPTISPFVAQPNSDETNTTA